MGEHMDGCTSIFSAPPFRVSGRKSTDWKEGVGGYDLAYLRCGEGDASENWMRGEICSIGRKWQNEIA